MTTITVPSNGDCFIDSNVVVVAGIDWSEYKRQLKKAEQWNVEVY